MNACIIQSKTKQSITCVNARLGFEPQCLYVCFILVAKVPATVPFVVSTLDY